MVTVLLPTLVTALAWAFEIVKFGGPMRVTGGGMGTHWRQKSAPLDVP